MNENIVYVVTNMNSGAVVSATNNDFDAWASFRDFGNVKITVFIKGNIVATIDPIITKGAD